MIWDGANWPTKKTTYEIVATTRYTRFWFRIPPKVCALTNQPLKVPTLKITIKDSLIGDELSCYVTEANWIMRQLQTDNLQEDLEGLFNQAWRERN